MRLKEKINIYYYLSTFVLTLVFSGYFLETKDELIAMLVAYVGIIGNQLMLFYGVSFFIKASTEKDKSKQKELIKKGYILLFLKFFLLAILLYTSLQMIGNKIFIPVANYVILLFGATIGLKK